jgi:hypothetical protein
LAITGWLGVVVFRTWTTGFAFNRELLLLYICAGLVAASIGRQRMLQVIIDWLPFALVLVVYDLSRGAATMLGTPTLWRPQVDADRWLFFGVEPTVWLQEHLKLPRPPWWEVVMSTTYMSFFILPYVVAGALWLRNRDDWKAFVRRFVALQFAALIVYILLPAAPPWAAARCTANDVAGGPSDPLCMFHSPARVPGGGLLGAMSTSRPGAHRWVERISTRGWGTLHLNSARSLIDEGQASVNLVAAIPSLHAALTAMIAIFLWRRVGAKWRPALVAYALIMGFLLVYTAEHFVFDILLGWVFAVVVLLVIGRLESLRRKPPAGVAAGAGSARSGSGEVRDGARAREPLHLQAGAGEPAAQLVDGAARAEHPRPAEGAERQVMTHSGTAHQRVADQPATRLEAAGDLADGGGRVGQTVQAVEGHAQVELIVAERHPLDVGLGEFDVGAAEPGDPAAGSGEHVGGDVGGDVAHPLVGAQAAQRHPTATRDVEHGRAVRQVADDADAVEQQAGVGAPERDQEGPGQPFALHREVVGGDANPVDDGPPAPSWSLLCHASTIAVRCPGCQRFGSGSTAPATDRANVDTMIWFTTGHLLYPLG